MNTTPHGLGAENDTSVAPPTLPETQPEPPDTPAMQPWQLLLDLPANFHSLGLHLTSAERNGHLREVARSVWPGGTDFQRETTHHWYAEIADAAAADGAFYAGFCLAQTGDDRVSTASLIARLDPLDEQDADIAAAGLHEVLSLRHSNDVHRIDIAAGPAVLVFCGLQWTPPTSEPANRGPHTLGLAMADVYIPLPEISRLLVLSLSTPSLPELPDYVAILSRIAESATIASTLLPIDSSAEIQAPSHRESEEASIRRVFG